MFDFGEKQKKRRHSKAQSYDLTTVTRGVKTKQRKFKSIRKELLTEARSLLKSVESYQAKLIERFGELESLADKLTVLSDSYATNITKDDANLDGAIETLKSVIDEVTETKS